MDLLLDSEAVTRDVYRYVYRKSVWMQFGTMETRHAVGVYGSIYISLFQ